MKKILLLASLGIAVAGFGQQAKPFTVTGNVTGIKDTISKVYMIYRANDTNVRDSATIEGGKFSFRGTLADPVKVTMYVRYESTKPELKGISGDRDVVYFFVQPGIPVTINCVKDTFAHAEIKGGPMNTEYAKLQAAEKKYDDQLNPLYEAYGNARKAKDKPAMDSLEKLIDAVDSTKTEDVYGKYVKAHPTSPIAVFVLRDYAGYAIDADKISPMFDKLPAAQKQYAYAKQFKSQIDIAAKTGIGKMAMDFTQNDTLDKPVSLSNFKGKYVLLDFWASWCGPCRAENPNVVAAYNKYHDKGFNILSVSLDQPTGREKWLKAIHDDNLTWTHVSDLKFWDNAVAKEYGIQAIPQNFLIDPDGKIIGKDLRGDALASKLASIFTN